MASPQVTAILRRAESALLRDRGSTSETREALGALMKAVGALDEQLGAVARQLTTNSKTLDKQVRQGRQVRNSLSRAGVAVL